MAQNYDILTANLKAIPKNELVDGEIIKPKTKELGRTDIYPKVGSLDYRRQFNIVQVDR